MKFIRILDLVIQLYINLGILNLVRIKDLELR